MIIIFITYGGLCNQFYDIQCGINFCIENNIKFTFAYCSFRNADLISWHNEKFEKLFDIRFLYKYKNLYVNFDRIRLNSNNTYNIEQKRAIEIFKPEQDIMSQLISFGTEYIIIKQFWPIYNFKSQKEDVYRYLRPSRRLIKLYRKIKKDIIKKNKYNFIHYRYEHDFINHFQLSIEPLEELIKKIRPKFKNPELKIYIAAHNVHNLIRTDNNYFSNIIYKTGNELDDYNYEEKAFIDFMIGVNAVEIYGHHRSSFSRMLNSIKETNNYYSKKNIIKYIFVFISMLFLFIVIL